MGFNIEFLYEDKIGRQVPLEHSMKSSTKVPNLRDNQRNMYVFMYLAEYYLLSADFGDLLLLSHSLFKPADSSSFFYPVSVWEFLPLAI